MKVVNVYYAKTHLSQLLENVSHGQEIIIGKSGKPIARLIPFERPKTPRKPGQWKGKVTIAEDFDELPKDLTDAFGGKSE